jgi:AcrR family transcriptional regulator
VTDAGETEGDGRTARRERNREAVVTALLGLYREGVMTPSADEIATRAGVSARSLFRYFTDVDDLAFAAVARQAEHLMPLLALDLDPAASID